MEIKKGLMIVSITHLLKYTENKKIRAEDSILLLLICLFYPLFSRFLTFSSACVLLNVSYIWAKVATPTFFEAT